MLDIKPLVCLYKNKIVLSLKLTFKLERLLEVRVGLVCLCSHFLLCTEMLSRGTETFIDSGINQQIEHRMLCIQRGYCVKLPLNFNCFT